MCRDRLEGKHVLLKAKDVCKEIDGTSMLAPISMECTAGQSIGIQGKNGSGKSTLLKILAGIYEPTSGSLERRTATIGYVPEQFPEALRFKMLEYLKLTASFHRSSSKIVDRKITEYTQLFGIESYLETPLHQVSKGTRQKAGIIQALLMEPELLLLDEPLTGLDHASQDHLIRILSDMQKQSAIVFTAHEEWFMTRMATHMLQIETGEMVANRASVEMFIRVAFSNRNVFTDFSLQQINFEGQVAQLAVEKENSDQLLLQLLERGCSILEVKERK